MLNITRLCLLFFIFISNSIFAQGIDNMIEKTVNQTLHNQLPTHILKSKQIIAVNDGTVPPYVIYEENGNLMGLSVDLFDAIGDVLGVSIKHEQTTGISGILMGVQSGRYDLAIGPIADRIDRQPNSDLISYSISYDAIVVRKGNPTQVHSFNDFCGKRVAITIGSFGEQLFAPYSEKCVKEGKPAINLLTFKDEPTAILALKSDRIDVFATGIAMSSYFVSHSNGELELVNTHPVDEEFRYYAAVTAKNSPLSPIILAALQELYANGTYAKIMKKWNMEAAMLAEPGINLVK